MLSHISLRLASLCYFLPTVVDPDLRLKWPPNRTHDLKDVFCWKLDASFRALTSFMGSKSPRWNILVCSFWQCWGFVTFWYGSGSSDPYLWLTDPGADPGGPKTYGSGSPTLVWSGNLNTVPMFPDVIFLIKNFDPDPDSQPSLPW
jgi:hypothetical protein